MFSHLASRVSGCLNMPRNQKCANPDVTLVMSRGNRFLPSTDVKGDHDEDNPGGQGSASFISVSSSLRGYLSLEWSQIFHVFHRRFVAHITVLILWHTYVVCLSVCPSNCLIHFPSCHLYLLKRLANINISEIEERKTDRWSQRRTVWIRLPRGT